MTTEWALNEVYRLVAGACDDYSLIDGKLHPFLEKVRERLAEGGDLRCALSSPYGGREPLQRYNAFRRVYPGGGVTIHHREPKKGDVAVEVIILPAEEVSE